MADVTVHIVDDDPPFRDSVRVMLEVSGYDVIEYDDGQAFAEQAAHAAPGCALVDVNMPGMDGIALQERLNDRGIAIPVIVMTGHADVAMAVRAMKAGAVDFVEKPFTLPDLIKAISAALARRGVVPTEDGAVAAFRDRLAGLTGREREILESVVAGNPTKVIAYDLAISARTVDAHRLRIGDKLGVTGLSNLVRLAIAAGVKPRPGKSV